MNTDSVSIRKTPRGFSVDIRPMDKDGIAAPCGTCQRFRFIGDALIWVKEITGKDIPANWPNLENFNWQSDFNSTIPMVPQVETVEQRLERLAQKFSRQRPVYLSRELDNETYIYFITQGEHEVSFGNEAAAVVFSGRYNLCAQRTY
jgi:hypothetical protein